MSYEVQTRIGHDWENVWTNEGEPHIFPSRAEAAAELADHLRSMAYAVKNDYLEDFNPAEYRIKKL